MGSWGVWRERTDNAGGKPSVYFDKIHANIATDCSGLGVPELAMQAIANKYGMTYQVKFA